jgi:hypothetical protein
MNYLQSFIEEKKRAERAQAPADETDKTRSVSFGGESRDRSSATFFQNQDTEQRLRWPEHARPANSLRRCGALICQSCNAHSPSRHQEGCAFPRFEACRSRWFWLSAQGAIKCVACAAPDDLTLVEAWILARETGDGGDGLGIPGEILSLLHTGSPIQ